MPAWIPLAVFAGIAFFAARGTKGLVSYVLWITFLVLAGATLAEALADWRLVLGGTFLLAALVTLWVVKRRRKRREKEKEDRANGVHVHFYNRP